MNLCFHKYSVSFTCFVSLSTLITVRLLFFSHFGRLMVSHMSFILHFPEQKWCWDSFHIHYWPSGCHFLWSPCPVLAYFFLILLSGIFLLIWGVILHAECKSSIRFLYFIYISQFFSLSWWYLLMNKHSYFQWNLVYQCFYFTVSAFCDHLRNLCLF